MSREMTPDTWAGASSQRALNAPQKAVKFILRCSGAAGSAWLPEEGMEFGITVHIRMMLVA